MPVSEIVNRKAPGTVESESSTTLKVTSPDSNRKIVAELKKYTDQHEQRYGRFPKTLIFAANDLPHTSHADQLVNSARDIFGSGDSFVQKITGSYTNVVGLPLYEVTTLLSGEGYPIRAGWLNVVV